MLEELKTVTRTLDLLESNHRYFSNNTISKIEIKGKRLVWSADIDKSKTYSGNVILNSINHIDRLYIPPNNFESENLKYSPLEADNFAKNAFDMSKYRVPPTPSYPLFSTIMMAFIMANGLFPTFDEFAAIYLQYYFEYSSAKKPYHYDVYKGKAEPPRFDIGKMLASKEVSFENQVITCTSVAKASASCWPCKDVTTDMVLNRLYKAYPSLCRKFYTIFTVASITGNVEYQYSEDTLNGIHMRINGHRIKIGINTISAQKFATSRYANMNPHSEKIINFLFDMDEVDSMEFLFPTKEGIKELIRVSNIKKLYADANICANATP